jgi:Icc-related predicted phosphoesterase
MEEVMENCLFVSDLHGKTGRYKTLFSVIRSEKPKAVFVGGDLLSGFGFPPEFILEVALSIQEIKKELAKVSPRVFIIPGNDDPGWIEEPLKNFENLGVWEYIHNRQVVFEDHRVFGYAFVPPTPFLLKDWEKYDVSRYVDPGCIPPEEGRHTQDVDAVNIQFSTIQDDLERLTSNQNLENSIFLFHAPPWNTKLDRAALDGISVDHAPLDPHIGSIAIRRFIENRQPLITLHGHVHESSRLTGEWKQQIGRTWAFSAAHDGEELAMVRFNLESPGDATRELISV